MTTAELKNGIRNIELTIVYNVRELGDTIAGSSFVWNYSVAHDNPPEIVFARITTNTKTACLVLPREYCQDCAITISRPEVCEAILDCVGFLTA